MLDSSEIFILLAGFSKEVGNEVKRLISNQHGNAVRTDVYGSSIYVSREVQAQSFNKLLINDRDKIVFPKGFLVCCPRNCFETLKQALFPMPRFLTVDPHEEYWERRADIVMSHLEANLGNIIKDMAKKGLKMKDTRHMPLKNVRTTDRKKMYKYYFSVYDINFAEKGTIPEPYPLKKQQKNIIDGQGFVFQPNSHGGERIGYSSFFSLEEVRQKCFIAGKYRMGFRLNSDDHYDLQCNDDIPRIFCCHEDAYLDVPCKKSHVNLYPNDTYR